MKCANRQTKQPADSPYKPQQASGCSPALPWLCRIKIIAKNLTDYSIYTKPCSEQKADLEARLAKEKIQAPVLKYDHIRYFFERFIDGDPDDINYRRALVDTFINRIYLFDDHMEIFYNAQNNGQVNIPLGEPNGSPKGILVEVAIQYPGINPEIPMVCGQPISEFTSKHMGSLNYSLTKNLI